jgi:ABC-2 type transport system permease protein
VLTSVFAKGLRDRTSSTVAVVIGTLLYGALGMGVYSSFDDAALDFVDEMPEGIRAIYGTDTGSSAGLVLGAMFSLMAPLMVLVYSISGGTNASTGEERSQSLGLLLANPVSRTRVLLAKAAVVVIGVALFCVATWGGVEAIAALTGIDASEQNVLAACVQLVGLGVMFGGLALVIGSATGRSIGSGITATIAAVSYLITTLLPTEPDLERYAKLTPWYLYSGGDPLNHGVDWPGLIAMLAIAAALAAASVILINRRDLRE